MTRSLITLTLISTFAMLGGCSFRMQGFKHITRTEFGNAEIHPELPIFNATKVVEPDRTTEVVSTRGNGEEESPVSDPTNNKVVEQPKKSKKASKASRDLNHRAEPLL